MLLKSAAVCRFCEKATTFTYYHYDLPLFTHPESDLATFRMVTSQFCINGHVTQAQLSRLFGLIKLKAKRKETPCHIKVQELPESERFNKLGSMSKHFIDTIKIVAYRAETALANIVREFLPKPDQARAALCALYANDPRKLS